MRLLSTLYGAAARRRRRWYASRPAARRRLGRPVISVGALAVGGSGKTPVAAYVAELLARLGERPAVLSRGYRRAARPAGVVVVRDPDGIRAGVDEAGDEPLMLAERLPGACVLVCADRHRAGRLAEERFDATVHVLDDGFQHLSLDRDVDLVVIGAADAVERRTLPAGRLREHPDTAGAADALLVEAPSPARAASVARRFGACPVRDGAPRDGGAGADRRVFRLTRRLGKPILEPPPARVAAPARVVAPGRAVPPAPGPAAEVPPGARVEVPRGARVVVMAGIAHPAAFADAVRAAGYDVAALLPFADHHRFSARDVAGVARRAAEFAADAVLTTEKDMVRLRPLAPFAFPVARVPLHVAIEPAESFEDWLADRLRAARSRAGNR